MMGRWYPQSDIMTREEAMEILLNGTEGYKEYEVQRVTPLGYSPSQRCKYLGSSAGKSGNRK